MKAWTRFGNSFCDKKKVYASMSEGEFRVCVVTEAGGEGEGGNGGLKER